MQCGTMEALHCTNKERCVLVKVSTVTPSKIIKRMIMRHILLMILMTFNGFYCCFSKVTIQKKNTYIIYTSLNTSRVVDYRARGLLASDDRSNVCIQKKRCMQGQSIDFWYKNVGYPT